MTEFQKCLSKTSVKEGDFSKVRVILQCPGVLRPKTYKYINQADGDGATTLYYAARENQSLLVQDSAGSES